MSTDSLHFVAAAFPTNDGADFALGRLKTAQIKRGNVALISRGQGDRLRIRETHDWGMGKSAILGGLTAILVPGIGVVGGLLGGAGLAKLIDAGLPDDALRKLGAELTPDSSALVILIDPAEQAEVERILGEAGGKLVASGLKEDLAGQFGRDVPPDGEADGRDAPRSIDAAAQHDAPHHAN
jgi:uncharacterized membrane protein